MEGIRNIKGKAIKRSSGFIPKSRIRFLQMNFSLRKNNGFTMVELLFAMIILMSIFIGVMYSFIKGIELSDLSRNSSTALLALRNKLSQVEDTAYDQIYDTFNEVTFTVNGLNGIGLTYVDKSNSDFLEVKGVFCWQEKNNRVIGEDINLNGQIEAQEDINGNNEIDSVVEATTLIYKT